MLIYRDMYADVKFLSTVKITTKESNTQQIIANNKYYLRILIANASCIGNGLDLDNVDCVVHTSFPTSIVGCVQEMGTCEQNNVDPMDSKDQFDILGNL